MTVNSKMSKPEDTARTSKPMSLLRSALLYFKMLGSCLVLYGMGYYNISTSWIIFGCLSYFVYSRALQKRALMIDGLKTIGRNEKKIILETIAAHELPSWVYFPDVERAEWINQILNRMWPYICNYAEKVLIDSVQPSVNNSLPSALKPFSFAKIDLGDTPPRIGGVKVYESENIKRNEIVMDLDFLLYSDARIQVQCGKVVAGIKEFELRGTLRIVMKPLVPIIPFAGACTVCFLDNPDINFLLTDMGNIMTLPGLQQTLMGAVRDVVASIMVLPNRIPIQLVSDLEIKQIRFPEPHGVIRINVISGRDLKASDVSLIGKGTSDPYTIVKVGAQTFTTKVCQRTLQPTWNEYFEAVIDVKDGQNLTFEVMDKDQGNKDDPLGMCFMPIETVYNRGFYDSWIMLEGVKKGSIHVKLQWMDLSTDANSFQTLSTSLETAQATDFEKAFGSNLSTAYLFVLVDMAKNLNLKRIKSMAEPSPYASVRLGRECKTTPIKARTNNPVWENVMHFMVQNPMLDELSVTVRDSKTETKLGSCKLPLRNLVNQPDMTLDQPFTLTDTGGQEVSTIFLRLELKALAPGADRRTEDMKDRLSPVPTVESEVRNRFEQFNSSSSSVSAGERNRSESPLPVSSQPTASSSPTVNHRTSDNHIANKIGDVPDKGHNQEHDHDHGQHSHEHIGQSKSSPTPKPSNCSGAVELTAHYCEDTNRLGIIVHQCKDLPGVEKDGLSDPYVKLQLKFVNGAVCGDKRKTQVVKNSLDPYFDDERFEFSVDCRDITSLRLHVEVKNQVRFFQRSGAITHLGQCVIPLNSDHIKFGYRQWHWLVPEHEIKTSHRK